MSITKETSSYFGCNCEEGHYEIEVTEKMKTKALQMQSDKIEVDDTDERPPDVSMEHAESGKLGEIVVKKFLSERGISVEFNSGWEFDMVLKSDEKDEQSVKAEIKTRNYTETGYAYNDCLIRDRRDTPPIDELTDVVIQVMINGYDADKAYVTGFTSGLTAASSPWFGKAKTHETRKVNHERLVDLQNLINKIKD